MDRFLKLSSQDRDRAFREAGAASGFPSASVTKDFWVCLTLRELFRVNDVGDEAFTFKGGTSLSKAWGMIDRFSEDIDITVGHRFLGVEPAQEPQPGSSRKEQERRIALLRDACQSAVHGRIAAQLSTRLAAAIGPRGWNLSADDKDPDRQTLLFAYPGAELDAASTYLRPMIKLEFGARGEPWPAVSRTVTPIVAEAIPGLFDAPAISVRALRPERTFLEKAMLLHEERMRSGSRPIRTAMSRHYYDVYRLIEAGIGRSAMADDTLFEQIVAHRRMYFRYAWMDYSTLTRDTLDMLPAADHLDEWRRDYEAMQREMFAVPPPEFDSVLGAIAQFQSELIGA